MDYSGFDREHWIPRTCACHREDTLKLQNITTKAELSRLESEMGCRYSELIRLPYFDAPRMLVIDPMHNLFLGRAKHFLKSVWVQKDIINDGNYKMIQERVNCVLVPSGMGRIPYKIQSGFASFTADQWKNWVNYFSLIALHDILNGDNLECWRHFVLACRILTLKSLSTSQIVLADALLMQFCKRTERLYHKDIITPNMHMHSHIRSCIEDYSPSHGFWLFAFERYNGILGRTPNNNRSIEVQLMNRFVMDTLLQGTKLPEEYSDELSEHFTNPRDVKLVGSLADTICSMPVSSTGSDIVLPSHRSRFILMELQIQELQQLLSSLLGDLTSNVEITSACCKYVSIKVNGKQIGAYTSRSRASSIVLALWKSNLFGYPLLSDTELEGTNPTELLRAARINHFIYHSVSVRGSVSYYLSVSLSWYQCHPKLLSLGKPLTVWCHDLFEPGGVHSIVPIELIKHRTVSLVDSVDGETVLIVNPCVEF